MRRLTIRSIRRQRKRTNLAYEYGVGRRMKERCMEGRQFHSGIAIGVAIGALLAAASFCYLLAFEPGGFKVGINVGVGMMMIGLTLGAILGWAFSRPRPTAEAVIGVPRRRSIRVVMWFTTAMALLFALGAG